MDGFTAFLVHELIHIFLGLVLFLTLNKIIHKTRYLIWAFLVSIFLDLDHLFDYFLALGFKIDIHAITQGIYFDINNKVYIILHSWELTAFLLIIGFINRRKILGKYLIATSLGMFTHILLDQFWYHPPVWNFYFLLVRILNGFSLPENW